MYQRSVREGASLQALRDGQPLYPIPAVRIAPTNSTRKRGGSRNGPKPARSRSRAVNSRPVSTPRFAVPAQPLRHRSASSCRRRTGARLSASLFSPAYACLPDSATHRGSAALARRLEQSATRPPHRMRTVNNAASARVILSISPPSAQLLGVVRLAV